MKQIYIIAVLFLFFFIHLNKTYSQDNYVASTTANYFYEPKNLGITTPQMSDFMRYGNLNINHYNGLLDMNISLDQYKDHDFEIPICLKYLSNGFTPNKRPSIVGLNWILNCGGSITRIVRGSPDEVRGFYTFDKTNKYLLDGLLVAIRANNFSHYSTTDLLNFNFSENKFVPIWISENNNSDEDKTPYVRGDIKYDLEPDIFNYNFGNYSGSFIIGNDGIPVLLNNNGCKIDISGLSIQSYSLTEPPIDSKIVINTPDGYIYEFGGNSEYMEYIIPNNPTNCRISPRQINTWVLKSITAPNGRTVNYSYNSKKQKIKYHSFIENAIFEKFEKIDVPITSDPNSVGTLLDPQIKIYNARYTKNFDNYLDGLMPPVISSSDVIFENIVNTPIIDVISIDNYQIKFNLLETTNGFYDSNDKYDKSYYLNSVTFKQKVDLTDNYRDVRSISFKYINSGSYFFLDNLNYNKSNYNFRYNLNVKLPDPLTISVDHWGFWNGGYDNNLNCGLIGIENTINKTKAVNPLFGDVSLLKTVIYPTGGSTDIIYEQNRYMNYYERDYTKIHLEKKNENQSLPCGGVRVSSITDFDPLSKKSYNTRKYHYTDINRKECGVITVKPIYVSNENYTSETNLLLSHEFRYRKIINVSANTLNLTNYTDEYPICYPSVIEEFEDKSFILYEYTSFIDIPDAEDTGIKIYNEDLNPQLFVTNYFQSSKYQLAEKHNLYLTNDLSQFRGKLKSRTKYSNGSVPIITENNTYNFQDGLKSFNVSIKSVPIGYASYKLYLTPCNLIEKNIIDNEKGISTKCNYYYNENNFIRKQTNIIDSKLKTSVDYLYPSDYSMGSPIGDNSDNSKALVVMNNKNIVNRPVEILNSVNKDNINYATSYLKFNYFVNNGFPVIKSVGEMETNNPVKITNSNSYISKLKEKEIYHNYDGFGNPTYITTKDNIDVVYVWSYKGQHLIAEIKNATYEQVKEKIGTTGTLIMSGNYYVLTTNVPVLDALTYCTIPTESDLIALNNLRSKLPNSLITTYTYKPLVGMSTQTDPRGVTTYYNYDMFNRLHNITDFGKNILKQYIYHYQGEIIE